MKFYELTYLIRPEIGQAQSFSEKINSLIQEKGGILDKIKKPEKTILAYEMKQGSKYFKTAFLCSLNFYLDSKKIEGLKEKLKKEKEILRFSFFKKEVKRPLEGLKKVSKRRKPPLRRKPEKVELKKIEEKIKEIVGE